MKPVAPADAGPSYAGRAGRHRGPRSCSRGVGLRVVAADSERSLDPPRFFIAAEAAGGES